ncbi:MAG: hypothetical protein ACXV2A_06445 [Halobacteriota archaeon]
MKPEGDVTLVFVEPATLALPDLQSKQLIPKEYEVRAKGGDVLRAIVNGLMGDKKTDILDELKKSGAALKLQELIDYFSDFDVESVDLNVAATVGGGIFVLTAQGTAGVTVTVKPKPKS